MRYSARCRGRTEWYRTALANGGKISAETLAKSSAFFLAFDLRKEYGVSELFKFRGKQ